MFMHGYHSRVMGRLVLLEPPRVYFLSLTTRKGVKESRNKVYPIRALDAHCMRAVSPDFPVRARAHHIEISAACVGRYIGHVISARIAYEWRVCFVLYGCGWME